MDQMGKVLPHIMAYLPQIMAALTNGPAFLLGFVAALLYLSLWVGSTALDEAWRPTAAFDVVGLALVAWLVPYADQVLQARSAAAAEKRRKTQFAHDINRAQRTETLD